MRNLDKKILFIIGGQRSGTTYLTNLLNQHPKFQFLEPLFPEPKFFVKNPQAVKREFLLKFYDNNTKEVFAEKSTSYFEHEVVLQKIKQEFPKSLVIFLVRNPVDRTISNYFFTKQNGLETRTIKEVFINKIPQPFLQTEMSVNPFDYAKRSQYSIIIPKLQSIFGQQLLLLSFDELVRHPQKIITKVLSRLNLDLGNISYQTTKNESVKNEVVTNEILDYLNFYFKSEFEFLAINQLN